MFSSLASNLLGGSDENSTGAIAGGATAYVADTLVSGHFDTMYESPEDYDPQAAAEHEYLWEHQVIPGFRYLQIGDRVACRDTSMRGRFTEYVSFDGTFGVGDGKESVLVDNALGMIVSAGEEDLLINGMIDPSAAANGLPLMDSYLARQKAGVGNRMIARRRQPKPKNRWFSGDRVTYNPGDEFYLDIADYVGCEWHAGTIISLNPLTARLDNGKISSGLLLGRCGREPLVHKEILNRLFNESEVWYFPNCPRNFGQRNMSLAAQNAAIAAEDRLDQHMRMGLPTGKEEGFTGMIGRVVNYEIDKVHYNIDDGDRYADTFGGCVTKFPMQERLTFRYQMVGGVAQDGAQKMSAVIPAGIVAGGTFPVKLADGRVMNLTVPQGMGPGMTLQFTAPAPTPTPNATSAPLSPQSGSRTMSTQIPAGVIAGGTFPVKLADGRVMNLTVPQGMGPGMTLQFRVPATVHAQAGRQLFQQV